MQILIEPEKTFKSKNVLPEKPYGYPSFPTITENRFVANEKIFVHPAEKPQFNYPGYRAKLYDPL